MEPPKFVIASGPTGARLQVTEVLAESYDPALRAVSYDTFKDERYTGVTTDYRHELMLATRYADDMMKKRTNPVVFSHSLLDSVAYSSLKVERYMAHGAVSEYAQDKSILTFGIIGAMFRDTFKADEVLFLSLYDEDADEAYEVQERVRMILDEFNIPYHNFEFLGSIDEEVDKMISILEPHMAQYNERMPKRLPKKPGVYLA